MPDPSLRTSRRLIAGGLLAAAILGGGGFYLGLTFSPKPEASPPAAAAAPAKPSPRPMIERMLTRADLLTLAASTADAAAAGREPPEQVRRAAGRRFELAMPFGCAGPAGADSAAQSRWQYDADAATLRMRVAVTRWEPVDWRLSDSEAIAAIEGFWIDRPWSSATQCAPWSTGEVPAVTNADQPTEQTLAVAQFFAGDARREALRDGRPFESTQRVPAEGFAAPQGLRLVLSGRIDRVPRAGRQGAPIHCTQPGGDRQRPRCIIAVKLDQVRIENPASGETLATWQIGGD